MPKVKKIYKTISELKDQKYEILTTLCNQYKKEYHLSLQEAKTCALWHFNCMLRTSKYVFSR